MAPDDPITPTSDSKANRFTLTDSEGVTRIVYFPTLSLTFAEQSTTPQLYYSGLEGEFIFTRDNIEQQQSHLGLLVSVTLVPTAEEQLALTLILPPINLAGQLEREFMTIAIKTKSQRASINSAGAALTYEGFALHGVAEMITITT